MTDDQRLDFIKRELSEEDYIDWRFEYTFTNGSGGDEKGTICQVEVDKMTGSINEVTMIIDDDGNVCDYSPLFSRLFSADITDEIISKADNYLLSLAN